MLRTLCETWMAAMCVVCASRWSWQRTTPEEGEGVEIGSKSYLAVISTAWVMYCRHSPPPPPLAVVAVGPLSLSLAVNIAGAPPLMVTSAEAGRHLVT